MFESGGNQWEVSPQNTRVKCQPAAGLECPWPAENRYFRLPLWTTRADGVHKINCY